MIYIYIFVPLLFIGLLVWNTISGNRRLKQIKKYSAEANVARIILWLNIDSIDDQKPDFTYSYWKNVENPANRTNTDVALLLLRSGSYNLVVSSKSKPEYRNISIKVDLKSGITYKLGCDATGVYFKEEENPNLYNL